MKKEYMICRKCKIKRRCHRNLVPQIMSVLSLRIENINPNDNTLYSWMCTSFTCQGDGAQAASSAIARGTFVVRDLVELDGTVVQQEAALFVSPTKPIATRVVTRDEHIYSRGEDGRFYRAHKIMRKPIPHR